MDPLSIIASVITLIEGASATYKTIEKITNLPKAFHQVKQHLPLVQQTFEDIQTRLNNERAVPDDERKSILDIAKTCKKKAGKLKDIFDELQKKSEQDGEASKSWAHVRLWYHEALKGIKGHRVESLMNDILEDAKRLALREIFKLATQEDVEKIKKAIEELAGVEASLDDDEIESRGIVHATQNVDKDGIGQQNIPKGGNNKFMAGKYVGGDASIFHVVEYRKIPLPYRRADLPKLVPGFVGRDDEIQAITNRLEAGAVVALTGIASIGKSQTALKFCHQFKQNNPHARVFWVKFDKSDSCDSSFYDIARDLEIPGIDDLPDVDVKPFVSDWLSDNPRSWLLVLDNADDEEVFKHAANSIPVEKGRVIITSQSARLPALLHDKPPREIHIGQLPPNDAIKLFERAKSSRAEPSDRDALLKLLGYHPLGIMQASAYLSGEGGLGLKEMAQDIRQMQRDDSKLADWISNHVFANGHRHELQSLGRTLMMQFDRLSGRAEQQKHPLDPLSPHVVTMLAQLRFMYSQDIPRHLLQSSEEKTLWGEALQTLRAQSLIAETTEDCRGECTSSFAVQRFVQLAIQTWLDRPQNRVYYEKGLERAVKMISETFPPGEFEDWARCGLVYPHAQSIQEFRDYFAPPINATAAQSAASDAGCGYFASLSFKMAWFEWRQGRYGDALDHATLAHEIQNRLAPDSPAALESKSLQGRILHSHGRYHDARQKFESIISTLKQSGNNIGARRKTSLLLALTLGQLREFKCARALLEDYPEGSQHDDPETLETKDTLAGILLDQGQLGEAEELLREVVSGWRARSGNAKDEENPAMLAALVHLAEVLEEREDLAGAEELLRGALSSYNAMLSCRGQMTGDPDQLICMNNLGGVLLLQEKYEAAEDMFTRALQGYDSGVGSVGNELNRQRVTAMINLAEVLERQSKTDALRERLDTMSRLAASLARTGRLEDAEMLHRHTLQFRWQNLPRDVGRSLADLSGLSRKYREEGMWLSAVRLRLIWLYWYIFELPRFL